MKSFCVLTKALCKCVESLISFAPACFIVKNKKEKRRRFVCSELAREPLSVKMRLAA